MLVEKVGEVAMKFEVETALKRMGANKVKVVMNVEKNTPRVLIPL